MMGPKLEVQVALLYEFSLDDHTTKITCCDRFVGLMNATFGTASTVETTFTAHPDPNSE
jgi:hypothetical protein